MTCAQYRQQLPADENTYEDLLSYAVAAKKQYSRCPN
jgi:hypothetical protein